MHSDESFSGFDPIKKRLFVRKRQDARRVGEDYAVVIFERGGRHLLGHVGVCANEVYGEVAALLGQFAEDFFSGRNRAVNETFCDGHDQKLFGCRFQRSGKFKQVEAQSESKEQWPCGSDIHCFHMTVFGISSPIIETDLRGIRFIFCMEVNEFLGPCCPGSRERQENWKGFG